ncbi:MAG: hypothetical protein WC007_12685, partial [Pelobacteraceae bacterium]
MLNLLFISDSPKVEYIKSVLQPVLKVIIDVVTDFDHGLKDVFEKRPATVCIQDQIGGVTGESVARHIQMLLGSSAPTFILLHTGNDKARTINGLYEHIVDLGQSNDAVAEQIKNTLKSLLGDQWGKIYIPPKRSAASVRSSVAVPEDSREDADKLVDDFLSDLETSGFSIADDRPSDTSTPRTVSGKLSTAVQSETPRESEHVSETAEFDRAQSINDDLVELLLMEAGKARQDKGEVAAPSLVDTPEVVLDGSRKLEAGESALPTPVVSEQPAPVETTPVKPPLKKSAVTSPRKQAPATAPPTPPAAEFRISQNAPQAEEHIPEDLLMAFEENYRSESLFMRRTVIAVLVCVLCAAGFWYLVKQKPQMVNSLKQRFIPSSGPKQAQVTAPVALPAPKPVPPPVSPPAMAPALPTFIPKDGHDTSYAGKNPGWERYIGKNA